MTEQRSDALADAEEEIVRLAQEHARALCDEEHDGWFVQQ
jgi:hypothetical protein